MATTFPSFSSFNTASIKNLAGISADINNTDVIGPEFRVYIEGVQVPFESISISTSYGRQPVANIQVPPASGLLDIIRGYKPKVHIFYEDTNFGDFRLLFWGHIRSNSYALDRGSATSYITFTCDHKNALLDDLTMDFTSWANPQNESAVDNNPNSAAIKMGAFNSTAMVVQALEGITGVAAADDFTNEDTSKLDIKLKEFEARLSGMPGIAVNIWNQIKLQARSSLVQNLTLASMYAPLLEEGLGFFKRMSGHPYLEQQVQNAKQPWCHVNTPDETKILIPPVWQSSLTSAISAELGVIATETGTSISGEMTSFNELIGRFYASSEYEMLTLASPAEIEVDTSKLNTDFSTNDGEKMAVETIIKPRLPFYFSPVCNVILPRMYSSISLSQEEGVTPTRIVVLYDAAAVAGTASGHAISVKAPASVRESSAFNALLTGNTRQVNLDLKSTLGLTLPIPGKHELGMGIRSHRAVLPHWLAMLVSNKSQNGVVANQEVLPAKGTPAYDSMMNMKADWNARYSFDLVQEDSVIKKVPNDIKKSLNYHDPEVNIYPYERIFFATLDSQYALDVAGTRVASIQALFNPYIICGYPMDIISDSPNHPSFHGLCTSVTHSITSRSCSTSINMNAATSYAELSNYYTPPCPPYLNVALKIANVVRTADPDDSEYADDSGLEVASSTLIQNPVAKAAADTFYREVLGVTAVAPDDLIEMASNRARPLLRTNGGLVPRTAGGTPSGSNKDKIEGRQTDDYLSSVGNLRLVSRPIESKKSIEYKFQYKFIDMTRENYNEHFMNYLNPILAKDLYMEPGSSLFLDYVEVKDFINDFLKK